MIWLCNSILITVIYENCLPFVINYYYHMQNDYYAHH